ncbi:uncharacterized protein LOC112884926 [Panicum hallii]|uniref:uncharacterized protein LOC112884926 n=1 Tax=Panicum hallii TaxID=206008 RepID=UPI000DF4F0C5|nr:uncharacterized protein LOC112884926 [Panicum hallii]
MAAALRLLLRCRGSAAAPPSLALLQPLFPGPFSTPCSPLLPAAASAGLLAPAPYLLRHYSSKPSKGVRRGDQPAAREPRARNRSNKTAALLHIWKHWYVKWCF